MEGAPPCLVCGNPSTWTSAAGYHACNDHIPGSHPEIMPVCWFCQTNQSIWTSPDGRYNFCDDCQYLYELAVTGVQPQPQNGGTLADLLNKDLDPIRWTVEGMIPEGLTFLAGKPKLGKSWLALVLALAVATGNRFLGYPTVIGQVLYIALEDSERRMQDRATYLGAQSMGTNLNRFHYRTEWASLDRGGLKDLEEWMIEYPDTKLIVIDTFGKIRGELPGRDKYAEEYNLLGMIQSFALKHGIAVILVHHLRKMAADDWIEQLSGSQAISGAADTILGLYRDRGQMDAVLRTVSRDVDELELALAFNGGRWAYMGLAEEYRSSKAQADVLEALRALGGKARLHDIAMMSDKRDNNTLQILTRLVNIGKVTKPVTGTYQLLSEVNRVNVVNERVRDVYESVDQKEETSIARKVNVRSSSLRSEGVTLSNEAFTFTLPLEKVQGFTESEHSHDDYEPDPDDLADPFEGD